MNDTNYRCTFVVRRTPMEVYDAITQVTRWWTINMEGSANAVGDTFTVQFGDVHLTTQRIEEAVPGERMIWHVMASNLPWLKDKEEWKGTDILFNIAAEADGTRLTVTHIGLTPNVECYAQCEKGWNYFLGTSLFELLSEGVGLPDTTERTHMDLIGHVHITNA